MKNSIKWPSKYNLKVSIYFYFFLTLLTSLLNCRMAEALQRDIGKYTLASAGKYYIGEFCPECLKSFPDFYSAKEYWQDFESHISLIPILPKKCENCRGWANNKAIYGGYTWHGYRRYFNFLRNHLIYCRQNCTCSCYWPETSELAAKINDLAYQLFDELLSTTALSILVTDINEQMFFMSAKPTSASKYHQHGVVVLFIGQSFFYSDYLQICEDLIWYAKKRFNVKDYLLIVRRLENVLEQLLPLYYKLYSSCLKQHSNEKIQQEKMLLDYQTNQDQEDSRVEYSLQLKDNTLICTQDEQEKYTCNTPSVYVCADGYCNERFDNVYTLNFKEDKTTSNYKGSNWLQSKILFEKGSLLNEGLCYSEAIKVLSDSIRFNAYNQNAYIERALAYFETNQLELAIKDYQEAKKLKCHPPFLSCNEWLFDYFAINTDPHSNSHSNTCIKSELEYFQGCIAGAFEGNLESMKEFIPSTLNSLTGIGNGLWALLSNSESLIDITPELVKISFICVEDCIQYFQSHSSEEIIDEVIPEFKEMLSKWTQASDYDKGKMVGFIIGKYGLGVFACSKVFNVMKHYRELRRANTMLTIEVCTLSAESNLKIMEQATKRSLLRQNLFKNNKIKIQWDRQNKHISGSHNFIPGRSKIVISKEKLESLISEHAGTGETVGDVLPGLAGYKERINFGEIIGECVYKENGIEKTAMTTNGILHYDGKGFVHLIPARP